MIYFKNKNLSILSPHNNYFRLLAFLSKDNLIFDLFLRIHTHHLDKHRKTPALYTGKFKYIIYNG